MQVGREVVAIIDHPYRTQTAQASRAAKATQDFKVEGNWAASAHKVSVDFLNDLYQAGVGDRNLYVDGTSVNGTVQAAGTLALMSAGSQSLSVQVPVPASVVVGSGSDTIDLKMAEDAFQGDAQFTVSVDGVQVGGTQTAQASQTAKVTKTTKLGLGGPVPDACQRQQGKSIGKGLAILHTPGMQPAFGCAGSETGKASPCGRLGRRSPYTL